jgi:hypothetical protein
MLTSSSQVLKKKVVSPKFVNSKFAFELVHFILLMVIVTLGSLVCWIFPCLIVNLSLILSNLSFNYHYYS